MRMKNLLLAALVLTSAVFAADCDGSFTLDDTHSAVVFNNQTRACYNWQVSYFSSTYSAVSVQFESAPNGSTSTVPGTWVAFAGTVIAGSNPNTAIDQATTTFSGSFPWVRIRLVSKTGTGGKILGRMLGAQLTTATVFPNPFIPVNNPLGIFIPPVQSDFTVEDPDTTVVSWDTTGVTLSRPPISASDTITKLCANVPTTPWTLSAAFVNQGISTGSWTGTALHNPAAAMWKWEVLQAGITGSAVSVWTELDACTGSLFATCVVDYATNLQRFAPVSWVQIRDDGTTRVYYGSINGVNWQQLRDIRCAVGLSCAYADTSPITEACFQIYGNNNVNGGTSTRLVSWKICPNSTGATC